MIRVTAYDGLRGWLLIIITCNHLWGNYVSDFTRSPFGFVSAAEAFVFLSGFVAYIVYRKLDTTPKLQTKRILSRVATIYLFHIAAITITFLFVYWFPLYQTMWSEFFLAGNFYTDKSQFFLACILLLEHPGYHDILIMYLISMLLLPFAMAALRKRMWYLVITISIMVWYFAPYINLETFSSTYQFLFPNLTPQVSYFDPLAWQLYFYLGVILSYLHKEQIVTFEFNWFIKGLILTIALIYMVSKQLGVPELSHYINNSGIAPIGIVINLLVLAYCFKLWIQYFPAVFTFKFPVFIGQHALPVFSFHTVVVYFLLPATHRYITNYWYWDIAACLFFVVLLVIPAKFDQLYRQKKQQVLTASTAPEIATKSLFKTKT